MIPPQLALLAWIPVVFYLYMRFPAQKAVVFAFVTAWLFLPQTSGFSLPGFPDYTRVSATSYGILLATFVYDVGRFSTFKFGWLDLPMLIWCLCPFASSISNGLGWYDGASAVLGQTLLWGVPYFLGRIYLNNLTGLRLLAKGMLIGGLLYIPLCLYEIRMTARVSSIVYGYGSPGGQQFRYGGFRPTVFMAHGLEVGLWMMAATLIGFWLWKTGVIQQMWGIPMSILMPILLITFVLAKSTGAWVLLGLGIGLMFVSQWFRTALPLLLIIVAMFSYLHLGATGNFTGDMKVQLVSFMENLTNEERAASLEFRLNQEEKLGDKARQRIIFGWGGWGRNRIYEYDWKGDLVDTSATDSLWMIVFGTKGLVGLFSLYVAMLLPVVSFCFRYPAKTWFHPKVAPAAAIAVAVTLYMMDCLVNAMTNPIFMLATGAISGAVLQEPATRRMKSNGRYLARRSLSQQRQKSLHRLPPVN